MNNFVMQNTTKVIFGKGTIPYVGEEIVRTGNQKVLLIAGGGSIKRNGVYRNAVSSLKRAKIRWQEVWGVQPNPVLSKVNEAVKKAKKWQADSILAIGGGSVIDSAKTVAAGVYRKNPWDLFVDKKPVTRALPLYTILTISAAGSEMNGFAVITNEFEKRKWNISGPALFPKVSIIDPSVQTFIPWKQTVNGAVDAISHIMEFYFMGGESETTMALDESLCRSIIKMTDRLQNNPKEYDSRANLAWAATLALNGISGAGQAQGDWASHGIEHALSAIHPNISHGTGLGVIFPAWIKYCQNSCPVIFRRWAHNVWGQNTIDNGIRAMKNKIKQWGHPNTLRQLGINESQFPEIAKNVMNSGMCGNLKRLGKYDIIKILQLAR